VSVVHLNAVLPTNQAGRRKENNADGGRNDMAKSHKAFYAGNLRGFVIS
jgi:hypothetical protein